VIVFLFGFACGLFFGSVAMAFMLAVRDIRWEQRMGARARHPSRHHR